MRDDVVKELCKLEGAEQLNANTVRVGKLQVRLEGTVLHYDAEGYPDYADWDTGDMDAEDVAAQVEREADDAEYDVDGEPCSTCGEKITESNPGEYAGTQATHYKCMRG